MKAKISLVLEPGETTGSATVNGVELHSENCAHALFDLEDGAKVNFGKAKAPKAPKTSKKK